ncbi:tetratricopeptide repeat protein [Sphingopyxis panaciterrae]
MTGDDDIKAFLPEPPPPAPKPRETAIAEALARFDATPAPQSRPRPESAPWWGGFARPQAGLLATAALVAAISLPFAWTTLDPQAPAADEQASRDRGNGERMARLDVVDAPAAIPAAKSFPIDAGPANANAPPPRPDRAAPAAKPVELARVAAPPPPPAMRAEERAPIIVQGQARARADQATPVAISAISAAEASADSAKSIVVTGARISPGKAMARGDWNACTVNDPGQKLSRCDKLAKKGTKEARSQADLHLSSGLKSAWQGDIDDAIAAFDRAIAVAPDLSVAYLNRGLAFDRQGDRARAIADLDRAVQYAPRSARAYYNRSILLRKYGDPARADGDEKRAIDLDPRYQRIRGARPD